MTGVVLSQGRSGQAKTDGCCAANQDCSHCESFRHGREVSIASSNSLGAVGENKTSAQSWCRQVQSFFFCRFGRIVGYNESTLAEGRRSSMHSHENSPRMRGAKIGRAHV